MKRLFPLPRAATAVVERLTSASPPSLAAIFRPIVFSAFLGMASVALGCLDVALLEPEVKGPCTGEDSDPVLRVCVWADQEDLDWINANPKERVEISVEVGMDGIRYFDAELEVHGGSTRNLPKLSYRLKFDEDALGNADFFGDGRHEVERIVLVASYNERTYTRAKMAMDLTREAGGLAPRVGVVQLWLNGEWYGLMLAIERIDENYLSEHGMSPDGYLYKAEGHSATWAPRGERALKGFEVVRGAREPAREALRSLFDDLATVPIDDESYEQSVETRLDLRDWVAWHRVMSFAGNQDTFTKNYYLYHDPTTSSRFRIVQWDADATFGNSWEGNRRPASARLVGYGTANAFAERYFRVPGYRRAYAEEYEQALAGPFAIEAMERRLDEFVAKIRPFAIRDLALWQPDYNFDEEVGYLRSFLTERHDLMVAVVEELDAH